MARTVNIKAKKMRSPEDIERRNKERAEIRRRAVDRQVKRIQNRKADNELDRWEASIPKRARGYNFFDEIDNDWGGNITSKASKKKVKSWVDEPAGNIILSGSAGTGKTTLACSMVSEWIYNNGENISSPPVFYSVNSLLSDFSFAGSEVIGIRNRCVNADILILDDLGAATEGITSHQKKMLWELINQRWSLDRPIIFTTNMAISTNEDGLGIDDLLGESAWDRVKEELIWVEMTENNFRERP